MDRSTRDIQCPSWMLRSQPGFQSFAALLKSESIRTHSLRTYRSFTWRLRMAAPILLRAFTSDCHGYPHIRFVTIEIKVE
ncbi:hypothetical protein SAMN05444358_11277 [Ruegeria halocynthiae]|uniref:Uncharacterized protein n=1 Tax=Ruegeria halocynthiae TaxID=985054 RepID=A0A1H3EXR8_9RHOB|nr:hypothetical protein SAMN05444358_11277 [Ruegeria halocynthiae]